MTIYIVCPESLEKECRDSYVVATDNETLGGPDIRTAPDKLTYLVWGSSRITKEEAAALTKRVPGVEWYIDELPSVYYKPIIAELDVKE